MKSEIDQIIDNLEFCIETLGLNDEQTGDVNVPRLFLKMLIRGVSFVYTYYSVSKSLRLCLVDTSLSVTLILSTSASTLLP